MSNDAHMFVNNMIEFSIFMGRVGILINRMIKC